ncbi:hypothetical protein ACFXKX_31720 [Streptomyces scopuliridis]
MNVEGEPRARADGAAGLGPARAPGRRRHHSPPTRALQPYDIHRDPAVA